MAIYIPGVSLCPQTCPSSTSSEEVEAVGKSHSAHQVEAHPYRQGMFHSMHLEVHSGSCLGYYMRVEAAYPGCS